MSHSTIAERAKLCKQFTSYNFPHTIVSLEQQRLPAHYTVLCSWKAAVKWNNVNNNIPQQTIFFFPSLPLNTARALRFQHRGKYTSEKKFILSLHMLLFVCYYSILILFFNSRMPHTLTLRLNLSTQYFFFFHSHSLRCHDMEWRKLYCYLFSRVSHIHSQSKKKEGNLSRESEKSENGMRSFVSVSEQENEADIKVWGEGWKTHFCVLSSTQYYLYTQRIAFSSSSNNDIKHP